MRGHEVSILMALIGAVDWRCGIAPRSKVSMMIMRPPQHGHGGLPLSTMVVGRFILAIADGEQFARACDVVGATPRCEQAVMADAVEAVGQHVDQEAADELVAGERHHLVRARGPSTR